MTTDPQELLRMAEELRRKAAELEAAAAHVEPSDELDKVRRRKAAAEAASSPHAEPPDVPEDPEPQEREPVTGLPEDTEEPIVDPAEPVDMRDELDKVRDLIGQRGFVRRASTADGEVWEKQGPGGAPGFRATFVSTPHGRIRLEIRNPMGLIVTQAEPATLVDSEIALQRVPRG